MASKIKDELTKATGYAWAPTLSDSENRFRRTNAADQFDNDQWFGLSEPAQQYCEGVAKGLPEGMSADPDYINKCTADKIESPQFPDFVADPEPAPAAKPAPRARRRAAAAPAAQAAPAAKPAPRRRAAAKPAPVAAPEPEPVVEEAAEPVVEEAAPAPAPRKRAKAASRRRAPAKTAPVAEPEPEPEPVAEAEQEPVEPEVVEVIEDGATGEPDQEGVKPVRGAKMQYLREVMLQVPSLSKKEYLAKAISEGTNVTDSTVSLIMYNTKHTLTVLRELGYYDHHERRVELGEATEAEIAERADELAKEAAAAE